MSSGENGAETGCLQLPLGFGFPDSRCVPPRRVERRTEILNDVLRVFTVNPESDQDVRDAGRFSCLTGETGVRHLSPDLVTPLPRTTDLPPRPARRWSLLS